MDSVKMWGMYGDEGGRQREREREREERKREKIERVE